MSHQNLDWAKPTRRERFEPDRGLRQRQLCELMGWDYRQVARTAKQQGMSTHAYVQQQTGWVLRAELYYPPEDRSIE
ncbi:hypothetical protein Cha6605_2286 [Chamaesiphon minutus PCC 6605]|uniref:Uncharacterized protein n=2 Tax=Chamaesiphon TaxID=217161 RepID=K9UGN7_CHAP6|nr:hypothetical protein Cha6605_2286 [Chamaesiphon minutus PCC 6605]